MPTPRPEMRGHLAAVERPGSKIRAELLRAVPSVRRLLGASCMPDATRLGDERVAVDAAAVVGDLDQDLVAGLARARP